MFNLTHDETSAIDIDGVWTGLDEFELTLRFNHDDQEDLKVHLLLNTEEVQQLIDYLQFKLARTKVQ